MKKRIVVISLAIALAGLSSTALAGNPGQFYVGAGVGQSNWNVKHNGLDKLDDVDVTANLRVGYVWHGGVDFALEGGYINLGEVYARWHSGADTYHQTIRGQDLFGGAKVVYHLRPTWFVGVHGGLLMGHYGNHLSGSAGSPSTGALVTSSSGTGWYAGVGVGHDFTRQFSLAIDYDGYHSKFSGSGNSNVEAVTVLAEYRF